MTEQGEQIQQIETKQTPIVVPDHCSIILDNPIDIPNYLQQLKKHGHIFLINSTTPYYHEKVSMLKADTFDEYARIIYKMMFDKRLLFIITDTASEFCIKIKNKTIELINLDREFCFGSGGTCSIENFWNNLSSICDNPNTSDLKNKFAGKPVVIVNSGPSLNKNIEVLKKYQDKVITIACSTAIGALHKANIKPTFLAMIDPYPMVKDFVLPYCTKDTILLASSVTCKDFIKEYPGPVIYFHTNGGLQVMGNMYKDLNVIEGVYTSATVTSAALSLSLFMGFDPIIFVGQDMCFDGDKVYADGITGVTNNQPFEVETLDGRKVFTLSSYKEISDYFNSIVPKIKNKEIINCSDGMGIKGAKVLTLQEVADKYFIDNISNINNNSVSFDEIKQQQKVVDKAKILADLCLIKKDIVELKKFLSVFKDYVNMLFEKEIDYEYIKVEVDEFFTRIIEKNGAKFINSFINWIWYLLPLSQEKNDKIGSLNLLDESFDKFLGLLESQIEILGSALGSVGDGNCG